MSRMDKDDRFKTRKLTHRALFHTFEMPKQMRDISFKKIKESGYEYLRIRIEEVDSGQIIFPDLFTFRRPENYSELIDAMWDVIKLEEELLRSISISIKEANSTSEIETTAWHLYYEKLSSPGQPSGQRVKGINMAQHFLSIQEDYEQQGRSRFKYKEFVDEYQVLYPGINERKLGYHVRKLKKSP